MISVAASGPDHRMIDSDTRKTVNVKHFPDMNLKKWEAWGFTVREVLRTPRYNFLFQKVSPGLFETEGDDRSYVLEGVWYRVDEETEGRLAKASWITYAILAVMFWVMLRMVWIGLTSLSGIIFVMMFFIVEGFASVALARLASATRTNQISIPMDTIEKVSLISDPGVLLIGWVNKDINSGLAIGFTREKARLVFDELKNKIKKSAKFKIHENVRLGNPPSQKK